MTRTRHEHSLRNQEIGQAYMIMLDVYDQCRQHQMSDSAILTAINAANPWGQGELWPQKAWSIALKEFCRDYNLPLPAYARHRPRPRTN